MDGNFEAMSGDKEMDGRLKVMRDGEGTGRVPILDAIFKGVFTRRVGLCTAARTESTGPFHGMRAGDSLGSARVPRAGTDVPPSRTFLTRRIGVRWALSLHTSPEVRGGRMPPPTRWKRALPGLPDNVPLPMAFLLFSGGGRGAPV